mgnify:FL=1
MTEFKIGDIYETDGIRYEVINVEVIEKDGVKIIKTTERIIE